jgi:hypothetical protein
MSLQSAVPTIAGEEYKILKNACFPLSLAVSTFYPVW